MLLEENFHYGESYDDVLIKLNGGALEACNDSGLYEIKDSDLISYLLYDNVFLQFNEEKLEKVLFKKYIDLNNSFARKILVENVETELNELKVIYSDKIEYTRSGYEDLTIDKLKEKPFILDNIIGPKNVDYSISIEIGENEKEAFLIKEAIFKESDEEENDEEVSELNSDNDNDDIDLSDTKLSNLFPSDDESNDDEKIETDSNVTENSNEESDKPVIEKEEVPAGEINIIEKDVYTEDESNNITDERDEEIKKEEDSYETSFLEPTPQDEYDNAQVVIENNEEESKNISEEESTEILEKEDLEDIKQKEEPSNNNEIKKQFSSKRKIDIPTYLMLGLVGLGTILEILFLWSFRDTRPNTIYFVVSIFFYVIAIGIPIFSIILFFIFENNMPNIHSIFDEKIIKNRIQRLIELYRSTFIKDENGNFKNKTRANAELYFNFDSVMDSLIPVYPISKALKLIGSSFIGLGILGTFIGFSTAMASLTFDSPDKMMEGIKILVNNGLTTAFNTSIVGVLCSLVYNFMIYHPLLHYVNGYFDNLCDELDNEYYISETEALMEYTMTYGEDGTPIPFSGSLNLIISNMSKQSDALNKFNEDLADRLANLRDDMSNSMNKISSSVSGDLSEKVLGSVQEEIEGLKESLVTATTELNQASESISGTIDKIDNEVSKTLQEFNSSLVASLESSKEAALHLETVPTQIENITDSLDKAGDKLSSVSDIVAENMDSVRDSLNGLFGNINDTQNNVMDILSKVQTTEEYSGDNLRELNNETSEIIEGFRRIDESLASIFTKIGEEINKYNSTVSGTLGSYLTEFSDASKDFSSTIHGTVSNFTNSLTSVNDTIKSIDESSGRFAESIKHLEKTLNK